MNILTEHCAQRATRHPRPIRNQTRRAFLPFSPDPLAFSSENPRQSAIIGNYRVSNAPCFSLLSLADRASIPHEGDTNFRKTVLPSVHQRLATKDIRRTSFQTQRKQLGISSLP